MLEKSILKRRDIYLNRLIAFQDTELIKIITGIRRCGKSKLMALMMNHLRSSKIPDEQILHMNFELFQFEAMDKFAFHKYIMDRVIPGKKMYLFFDEPHKIEGWEKVINSFRAALDCDIYVTGSNSHMLSSEYATYLSGRYVEIKMLPLSFAEFLYFHDFKLKSSKNLLGSINRIALDRNGDIHTLEELFAAYRRYGGMPGLMHVELNADIVNTVLDGIYNTVINNDILQRERLTHKPKIANPVLLQRIARFLADSLGSSLSYNNITNTLTSNKMLSSEKGKPSVHTVQNYVCALKEAFFYYEAERYDIKGKKMLTTGNKLYIVDPGFRTYLLGYSSADSGHLLENIVYLELLRRGYTVNVGKIDSKEVDFRASNTQGTIYVQVCETIKSEETRAREYAPYRAIRDNYRKIILTEDTNITGQDGIEVINIIDWLLEKNISV